MTKMTRVRVARIAAGAVIAAGASLTAAGAASAVGIDVEVAGIGVRAEANEGGLEAGLGINDGDPGGVDSGGTTGDPGTTGATTGDPGTTGATTGDPGTTGA
ncbi:hypothetical protein ACPCSA_27770, partial [Streptomyces lavendulocolor]